MALAYYNKIPVYPIFSLLKGNYRIGQHPSSCSRTPTYALLEQQETLISKPKTPSPKTPTPIPYRHIIFMSLLCMYPHIPIPEILPSLHPCIPLCLYHPYTSPKAIQTLNPKTLSQGFKQCPAAVLDQLRWRMRVPRPRRTRLRFRLHQQRPWSGRFRVLV